MLSLDAFEGHVPFSRQLLEFLVHNIPTFTLIIVLITAWRFEIIGGAVYILLAIVFGIFYKSFSANSGSLIIIVPLFVAGILFIIHQVLNAKSKQ